MQKIISLLALLLVCQISKSQSGADKIVAAVDSFSFIRPQEKSFIQLDKTVYAAGQSIWFKGYVTLNSLPTVLSKVLYVELADAAGLIRDKQMLKLVNGSAAGDIDLKEDLPAGEYYLRSYTLWMLNFPDYIVSRKIIVINNAGTTFKKAQQSIKKEVDVKFLPESGNLVAGVTSKIAFKAVDESGKPVAVEGYVTNSKNEKLVSFNSVHDGMGSFSLNVRAGEVYSAVVDAANNSEKKIQLPAVKEEGIVLTVDNNNPNKIFARVDRAEKNKAAFNQLLIMAVLNYQVVYMNKLDIDEGLDAVAINKKNMPPGIMQLTVLSADGLPLAQRIIFVANHEINNDLLQAQTPDLQKRKKNMLSFDAGGFNGLDAAVSVVNADAIPANEQDGIQSTLLLSSDLKGEIFNPGFYFRDKSPATLQALDLLMLTNGWTRYKLEDISKGNYSPLLYPFETGLSISGQVLKSNGKEALANGKINLILKGVDSTSILSEGKLNRDAVFIVDQLDFKREATVYYQGSNSKNAESIVSVKINPVYFDTVKTAVRHNPVNGDSNADSLSLKWQTLMPATEAKGKLLQAVSVKATKRSPADSLNLLYASAVFQESDQTLAMDQKRTYFDMWQYLQAMVPGIAVNKTDTGTSVNFGRYNGLDLFSSNESTGVQFFLNEVPVSADIIDALNPSDVALVKVYKGATAIALGAGRGAVSIYTSVGKSGRDWRDKGFDFFKKAGYSTAREFYSPAYGDTNNLSAGNDLRTTLYWNPAVKVINSRIQISFYNDDHCKKYRVMINGIDANGKLLQLEKLFE